MDTAKFVMSDIGPEKLDISALRALLAIAEHGGVTRAADHLALSQSAVSHKIRRLEETLHCSLLTRRPGEPLFTEAGERLRGYAHRIVDLHDEALADLGRKHLSGTIRLGMTEDATISGVSRLLGRFSRTHPDLRVRIRTGQSLVVQKWMAAGELDAAVMQVFDHNVQNDDAVLMKDVLHWVKHRDFVLSASQPIPFLSFDENCFYRKWGFAEGQAGGHSFETVLECPSAAGVRAAVLSGLGVALLNGMHLTDEMDVIKDVFPPPPEIAFVARAASGKRGKPVQALIAEVAREFRAPAAMRQAG